MELKEAFGKALKRLRVSNGLTQESFSIVSSRTYLSKLERGQKCPTLDKVEDLAEALGVHPLTLLVGTYLEKDQLSSHQIFARVSDELGLKDTS